MYAIIFTLLPIIGMTWAWSVGAVNVPKWDDHTLKAFIVSFESETSALGTLKQFLKQHNEHRIAYDRFFTWLDYNLFGTFSYKRLMAYGDLSLLALVGLFAVYLAHYRRCWYLFLPPIAFLLINLANWENLYWALSSLQNFGVVVWSLWTFYTLSHRQSPWLAIGLGAVATLISGNGLLVWPVGALILLTQRRFYTMLPWLVAAAGLMILYFFDYTPPTVGPPNRGSILDLLTGWLAFLGAAADALPVRDIYWHSVGLGGILLSFWLITFINSIPKLFVQTGWSASQAFAFGTITFLIGTAAVVVWNRYGFGPLSLLTSRYRIYSLTLLAMTYAYCLSTNYKINDWRVALVGLALSSLLWWSAFVINAHDAISLRQYLLSIQYNWTYRSSQPVAMIDSTTRQLITNAPAFYDVALATYFAPATGPVFPVDSLYRAGGQYVIRLASTGIQQAGTPSLGHPDRGVWLLFRSDRRTYLFPVTLTPQRNWRMLVGRLPLYTVAYPVDTPVIADDVDAGVYTLEVVQIADDGSSLVRPTGLQLLVPPHTNATQVDKNW